MKILFIVPYVPGLVRSRSYNLIHCMRLAGHAVTLGTIYTSEQEYQEVKQLQQDGWRVIASPMPLWRSLSNAARALPGDLPLQAVYSWQPALSSMLLDILNSEDPPFDVVHVEHLRGSKYGLAIRNSASGTSLPVVWDSVDSITYLFKLTSKLSKNVISRLISRLEIKRTARMERWLVDQFQRVVVTSPVDRQAFLDLHPELGGAEKIKVISHGVDLDYFTPDSSVTREPATLVISGKMSYHANFTMTLALVEDIMPLVWQKMAHVQLVIAGKDPPAKIQALAKDTRIQVTGVVPDIRPYLRKATIAVAPVQYSAGIQNKLLEAMACATPVISTSKCTAALLVKPEAEIILADSPREFADRIIELLNDPDKRQQIGQSGLEYVRRHHDWKNIASHLVNIYLEAIASR